MFCNGWFAVINNVSLRIHLYNWLLNGILTWTDAHVWLRFTPRRGLRIAHYRAARRIARAQTLAPQ